MTLQRIHQAILALDGDCRGVPIDRTLGAVDANPLLDMPVGKERV